MLTCPWFALAQTEVSAQSRNNLLYVVFVANDEQFFSLATPHERDLCETIDEGVRTIQFFTCILLSYIVSPQGFLFAAEVRHFCSQLYQGNVRTVEALCSPPESIILSTQVCTPVIHSGAEVCSLDGLLICSCRSARLCMCLCIYIVYIS